MRDCGLHMNIAHGGSQLTCSLFRGIANPQPVAHIERQCDRQRHYPAGGFEALHRRSCPQSVWSFSTTSVMPLSSSSARRASSGCLSLK